MATLDGVVGSALVTDGTQVRALFDRLGAVKFSKMGLDYAEMVARGYIFMACNQAAAALSTLSATATGFILTNPATSNVNIFLIDVCAALASAPAGVSNIHYEYGAISTTAVTQTTPLTVQSAKLGAFTGKGLAASAATLPATPVAIRAFGGGPVATGSVTSPFMRDELKGLIEIQPGSSINLGYLTTAISLLTSMHWAELPVASS